VPDWVSRTARPVLLEAVIERDGTRCWLCTAPVEFNRPPKHPRSPSLDHVVPRSKGGTNALSNLKLAHLLCNTLRGNRAAATVRRASGTPFTVFPDRGAPEDPASHLLSHKPQEKTESRREQAKK
jgi:hypothetical protein